MKASDQTDSATPMQKTTTSTPVARPGVPRIIAAAVALILVLGVIMVRHAESRTNKVALSATPKPVTTLAAKAAQFRQSRSYVGTIEPWIEAKVGPQFVSAYVSSVLVRPGAAVKRGDVIATLDCRSASASSKAVSLQAQALAAQQAAVAHEAERIQSLLNGGFVSPNEAEQKLAQSAAQKAQLAATQAKYLSTSLEVDDCVLRAPFDGEIATRNVDPGAFVRPGSTIVTVVDRRNVRICADVPEVDFDVVQPQAEVQVHVLATGQNLVGKIARRAPASDGSTRTLHFEMDVPNGDRSMPVGTTALLRLEVGQASPATEIPLSAAAVRGEKASIFVADNGVAHTRVVPVKGEIEGKLYLDTALTPGSLVITEGRELLDDGDKVSTLLAGGSSPLSVRPTPQQLGAHGS